jgi:hypothetical protein
VLRKLATCLLLGALLLVGKTALERRMAAAPVTTLRVVVKDSVSPEQLERAIDEAVLVEQAIDHGGALVDPLVREQLLANMRDQRRVGEREDDAALLKRALALGLHRADPVTRQRLVFQAEQLLTAGAANSQVEDQTLDLYLHQHADRYLLPVRVSFTQLALARGRHGAQVGEVASQLLQTLRREQVLPTQGQGDATLLPRDWSETPADTLDARFGPGFASQLLAQPDGAWSGPLESAYGQHLVFIHTRLASELPPLGQVHARVLADYRHDHRRALLRERLRALRGGYRVEVHRLRS